TLVRRLFTRRHLLEWVTSDHRAHVDATPASVLRRMAWTPIAGASIMGLVAFVAPAGLALTFPITALWCVSPLVAYATGRTLSHDRAELDRSERAAFRRVARKTWRFFDDLVGPTDHWLIPD